MVQLLFALALGGRLLLRLRWLLDSCGAQLIEREDARRHGVEGSGDELRRRGRGRLGDILVSQARKACGASCRKVARGGAGRKDSGRGATALGTYAIARVQSRAATLAENKFIMQLVAIGRTGHFVSLFLLRTSGIFTRIPEPERST